MVKRIMFSSGVLLSFWVKCCIFLRMVTFHNFPVWTGPESESRFTLKMVTLPFFHLLSPAGFIFQGCVQTVFGSRWPWWRPHVSMLMFKTRVQHISAPKANLGFFFCFFSFASSFPFLDRWVQTCSLRGWSVSHLFALKKKSLKKKKCHEIGCEMLGGFYLSF